MRPLRILDATRVLAETQDEYHALTIRDDISNNGIHSMTSLWEPSPAELELLKDGGHIRLIIMGTIHPPVILSVQGPPK